MKKNVFIGIFLILTSMNAQDKKHEHFTTLPTGSITPTGWIKEQMQKDLNGFVGHLDQIVPDLIQDPIYGTARLQPNSPIKDLGNSKEGDAEGEEQYKWWNSETQSNWWDGYIRNAILLQDPAALQKVKKYIDVMLSTQDTDGYLGIYDKNLRYRFTSENGELWSKATLYRALLAYYDYSKDEKVWNAVVRAVQNVMDNYPIYQSSPFYSGTNFNGGVSHGLTFTDVLDKMYQITKNQKYLDYALFLYEDFSKTYQSESDAQLPNIENPSYKLKSHGVHTFEHLRPLIVATYAKQNARMDKALKIYCEKIKNATTLTGGPIGDEWIAERSADATNTGYEYCSIHELLDSYTVLLQKSGNPKIAEEIETIFYNAAQGSRHPEHSCIAYLKTDNSYEMMGTKNGNIEPDRKQTRYKYSPAHQDVAVCCTPNAGRISPYFIEKTWFLENKNTLVAGVLAPTNLAIKIDNKPVTIEEITAYPYQNTFIFRVSNPELATFKLKIRKPSWATQLKSSEPYIEENGFLVFHAKKAKQYDLTLNFSAEVNIKTDANKEKYFTYGPLFFAYPIPSEAIIGKKYTTDFYDLTYNTKDTLRYLFIEQNNVKLQDSHLEVQLKNGLNNTIEKIKLIPFGKTILRQVSFKSTEK